LAICGYLLSSAKVGSKNHEIVTMEWFSVNLFSNFLAHKKAEPIKPGLSLCDVFNG